MSKNNDRPLKYFKANFLHYFLSFQKNHQKGYGLVVALGLGLISLGAVGLAIAKASNDKVNVAGDEQTKQALAIAEAGTARFKSVLLANRALALYPDADDTVASNNWSNLPANFNTVNQGNSCTGGAGNFDATQMNAIFDNDSTNDPASTNTDILQKNWVALNPGNPNLGRFKLIRYNYDTPGTPGGKGTLVIQGQVGSGNNASTAQIEVDFPINQGTADNTASVPALWISDTGNGFDRDKINGDIKIESASCTVLASITGAPDSDNLYDTSTQSITISPEEIPDTPTLPTSNLNVVTSPDDIRSSSNRLPRTGDTIGADGRYHYLVPHLDISGGSDIRVASNAKVVLYVQGNIIVSGNPDLNQNASNSSANLQIYGNTYTSLTTTKYGCGSLALNTACPTLRAHFNGTGTIKAFIHAPDAIASVNGGGNTNGNFIGSMWVRGWNSSSGNAKVKLDGSGAYNDYITSSYRTGNPLLGTSDTWERQQAQ